MRILYFLWIFLFLISCGSENVKTNNNNDQNKKSGETKVSLIEFCASTNTCRKNQRVKFMTSDGLVDHTIDLYWPVVFENIISLLPGDNVFIEAEIIEGEVVNLNQIKEIVNPNKTITFNFTQMDEGEEGMMLEVKNPFNDIIKLNINMVDFEGNYHETSSCPVLSNKRVFDICPHAIPELIISRVFILKDNKSMLCEY